MNLIGWSFGHARAYGVVWCVSVKIMYIRKNIILTLNAPKIALLHSYFKNNFVLKMSLSNNTVLFQKFIANY